MQNNNSFVLICLYVVVFASYSMLFFDDENIRWLSREDGVIENISAILLLLGSLLFYACYYYSSGSGNSFLRFHTRRNVFYPILAFVLFVSFGEEISWGQRIFGWETPRLLDQIGSQGETNLHNLWLFETRTPDGSPKSTLPMMFSASRLVALFWLVVCVFIPFLDCISQRSHVAFRHINLPIAPLGVGVLFLVHAIFFHTLYNQLENYLDLPVLYSVVELKEANYAFIISIFALYELRRRRSVVD